MASIATNAVLCCVGVLVIVYGAVAHGKTGSWRAMTVMCGAIILLGTGFAALLEERDRRRAKAKSAQEDALVLP